MRVKVSVVVPIYNVEKYLRACLDSIMGQTFKNLEIILVDDGSPDDCPRICDEYAKKDSRVHVFHKHNEGVSSARNLGLENSTGEWITFIDSDDYISDYFSKCQIKCDTLVGLTEKDTKRGIKKLTKNRFARK